MTPSKRSPAAAVSRLDAAARLILRDPELARDAVQEGFIRAWRNLPGVARSGSLRRLAPSPRGQFLSRHHPAPAATRHRGRPFAAWTPRRASTSRTLIADRDLLDGALRHLDPEWRAIVVMHYFLGMPLPEVAATLGIPLGTAKSRLHRSLGVMRASIAADESTRVPRSSEGRPA